eukprot:819340-Rhodomonas_salina.2
MGALQARDPTSYALASSSYAMAPTPLLLRPSTTSSYAPARHTALSAPLRPVLTWGFVVLTWGLVVY